MMRAYACPTKWLILMTFKWLRRQLSSNIDDACLCMPNKCLFWLYNESKKGYMEMSENFYLEILFFVLSDSVLTPYHTPLFFIFMNAANTGTVSSNVVAEAWFTSNMSNCAKVIPTNILGHPYLNNPAGKSYKCY